MVQTLWDSRPGTGPTVHGVPRYTGDLDLWVWSDAHNAEKIIAALDDFGLGSLGLEASEISESNRVVQLGYPPVRVAVMTSIDGVDFKEAWKNRVVVDVDGLPVPVISRDHLIANKCATGRHQDLADIERLGG